jgi:drug/metabolite transporter (DMT)-like permease
MHPLRGRYLLLLVGLAAIWGTAFMFISLGLASISPVTFAALRFDITFLFLLALASLRSKGPLLPSTPAQWKAVLIAGTLMTGVYHALLFWGQRYTTAAVAAVIVGLSPVLTTVFSRLLLHDERLGLRGLIGLALGFVGILVLASLKEGSPFDARGIGELAVVGAIASWALGTVLVKRAKHAMDVYSFSAMQTFVGAVLLHITAFLLREPGILHRDANAAISLLYLALVSSGLGFVVYFSLVEGIGAIRVTLVSYIAPIFATVAGALVLHEGLELRAVAAFIVIAAGFALIVRPTTASKPAVASDPEDP